MLADLVPECIRARFGIVQIGCGETIDLQSEAVVFIGLADPLHSDAPCGRDAAGVARRTTANTSDTPLANA